MLVRLKRFFLTNVSTRQIVFKNTFWLFVGELSGRFIRFFIVVYAARVLGPSEYGVFSYALTVAAFLTIFSDIGISALLTRETVKNPDLQQRYFSTGFVLKLILITICGLAALIMVPFISHLPGVPELMFLVICIFAFDSLREFGFGMNRSLERMEREAYVKITLNTAIAVLGFLFLAQEKTAYSVSVGYTIGTAIGLIMMALFLLPYLKNIFKSVDTKLLLPLFKAAWPIGLLSVLGAVMINTDMVMLGWWRSTEELGYYSTAQKIILLLYVVPTLIASSLFPTLSRLAKVNNARFRSILEKGLTASLALALPLTIGGLIVARPLIVLFFGQEYEQATLTFSLLLATILIVFPSTLLSNSLFAFNEQRQFIAFAAVGALSNAALNVLLIPLYGIAGAAIATFISQILANSLIWRKMKRTNSFTIGKHLARILPASITMGAVVLTLNHFGVHVLATIGIGAAVYAGLLFLFKEPLIEDIKLGLTHS